MPLASTQENVSFLRTGILGDPATHELSPKPFVSYSHSKFLVLSDFDDFVFIYSPLNSILGWELKTHLSTSFSGGLSGAVSFEKFLYGQSRNENTNGFQVPFEFLLAYQDLHANALNTRLVTEATRSYMLNLELRTSLNYKWNEFNYMTHLSVAPASAYAKLRNRLSLGFSIETRF